MRILVTEPIAEKGLALLRAEAIVDVRKVTPQELLEIVPEYDAIITRSETKITAEVIARGTRLKVVGRAGVGVDNIDVAAATERGILVVNVPGGNTISTAEHTWAMILALVRHIPQAMATLKAGVWDKKTYIGIELYGKTLGVIGFGRIGYEVAARGRAFGMKVLAYDPYANPHRAEQIGVRLVDLPTLLAQSDIVTIHAAKTPETARLIGPKEIALMKKGARIVNCARGGMVDEQALYDALTSGHLAGAALDVFAQEPITDHPLFRLPNVVFTPHLAASTVEAQEANGVQIAQNVLRALKGELVADAVNLPAVPPHAAAALVRRLPLAEVLGSFLGQAVGEAITEVEVVYRGEVAAEPTDLLTNTVLKGLLEGRVHEPINYINAPAVARRTGVAVKESKQVHGDPEAEVMAVRVRTGRGEVREVAGTLGREGAIRLVAVDGMPLDLAPSRHMIVTRHHDRPGMLGYLGTRLGQAGINIAGLALGRKSKAGEAVAVFLVDDEPPQEVLADLGAFPGVAEARAVTLTALPDGVVQ